MTSLSEGQVLWFVGAGLGPFRNKLGPVVVGKIGRKWAELRTSSGLTGLGRYRLNIKTLEVDGAGYGNPGRCYLSRADWLNNEGPAIGWQQLRSGVLAQQTCPAELSIEMLQQIAAQLGITIDFGEQANR